MGPNLNTPSSQKKNPAASIAFLSDRRRQEPKEAKEEGYGEVNIVTT